MGLTKDQQLAQIAAVCERLQTSADNIALLGLYVEAGNVLAGRQAIRALWKELHPDPPEEAPPESGNAPP